LGASRPCIFAGDTPIHRRPEARATIFQTRSKELPDPKIRESPRCTRARVSALVGRAKRCGLKEIVLRGFSPEPVPPAADA